MNTIPATVIDLISSEHLSYITVSMGKDRLQLLLAESCDKDKFIDQEVTLAFKETEIIITKELIISTANSLPARIVQIKEGLILTQITLDYQNLHLNALIPSSSQTALNLQNGDTVYWMIQASEISLLRDTHGR